MEYEIKIAEAAIYVGTYAKYTNGSLYGKWFALSDYTTMDEFYEACRVYHFEEEEPEFMFQDFEHVPDSMIGEGWLSPQFFELRDAMEDLSETQQSAFFVWLDENGFGQCTTDIASLITSFEDAYQGEYESEEDFAEELVDECYELPEFSKSYFDYAKFAHDLFMYDYSFSNGFVFRH